MLSKSEILKRILARVAELHSNAVDATQQAHDTATHKENVAENKYDTLGLEAGYLAFGQSQRVAECACDLEAWNALKLTSFSNSEPITVGALVKLIDGQDNVLHLFLGPAAGGIKIQDSEREVVVTPNAPLGKAISGQYLDDEFDVQIGDTTKQYCVEHIE